MNFFINLIVCGVLIFISAKIAPWVDSTFLWAVVFSLVLGVINATLWSLLRFVTFPLNFLTLWLVSLIISYFMILITDNFVDWFAITWWFWSVVLFAVVLAIMSALFGQNK